ncbi:MAG: DUF4840 domain-containing protein, partial [Candidatus Marinimicrobia bacterium]|nr:DUF4840 domain-containing protein [Candidatus Neomarinimicrobiota bacterium]
MNGFQRERKTSVKYSYPVKFRFLLNSEQCNYPITAAPEPISLSLFKHLRWDIASIKTVYRS